jgi:hypothetical protein
MLQRLAHVILIITALTTAFAAFASIGTGSHFDWILGAAIPFVLG